MAQGHRGRAFHWIGVERGWEEADGHPLSRLVALPPERLSTHALVVGATGSGKTNLLHHLIAQDALLGRSFVVLDLRGDLVGAAARICAGRVDPARVRVLDLREQDRPMGFDPLHGAGEPYFRALGVLDAVAAGSDSWGVQLAETLRYGLMLLAEAGEPLTRLEPLLYDEPFLLSCLEDSREEATLAFWHRYLGLARERRAALATPVLNKVSLLFSTRSLRSTLADSRPLDLGRHLDTPGSVLLVSLAGDETHGAGRMMGRIVLSSLCREVFARVRVGENRRNPLRLFIDEFSNFGEAEFEPILAEGRRFGLSLVLAHQSLAQLGPRMRSMVLNNVGAKVAFRCGREDAATISKDLTGDPKALDLAALRTGEAVLWTRGREPIGIEVNAPIVRNVGARDARTEAFLAAVRTAARSCPELSRRVLRPSGESPDRVGGGEPAGADDWLGEWL